jgi:acetyl-CoA carboxylase carboxyl transferase subunit alpha
MDMSRLRNPVVSVVIGEGGSGGALALGVADRLYMLEHAAYSVISPEGCAAILWKKKNGDLGADDFSKAAEALRLTAQDLLHFKIIDGIIPEPHGGAHRDPEGTAKNVSEYILSALDELRTKAIGKLIEDRYKRFRKMGTFMEETA